MVKQLVITAYRLLLTTNYVLTTIAGAVFL